MNQFFQKNYHIYKKRKKEKRKTFYKKNNVRIYTYIY